VVALAMCAGSAHATLVTGTDIFNGTTPGATFSSAPGVFELKTKACTIGPGCPLYTGVGVSGATAGEIDIDESISATFDVPTVLDAFQLMVLYEGPEFGDVQEVAWVTAFFTGGGSATKALETVFSAPGTSALWIAPGSVVNVSPALEAEAGVWRVTNPFGTAQLDSVVFTAAAGICGSVPCTNQSDYSIESMEYTPVPEPTTLLLLGGGLVGLATRRRRKIS
jgi:hypothetical protein